MVTQTSGLVLLSPLPPLPQALAMAVTALAGYGLVNSNLQLLVQIGEWG